MIDFQTIHANFFCFYLKKLHFSNLQAYLDIYNAKSKWDKDPEVYNAIVDGSSTFGLTNYHSAKERRDIIWPFYSRQNVKSCEKAISRQVSLNDRMHEKKYHQYHKYLLFQNYHR